MTENQTHENICKSVFKSGESFTTEHEFTNMWVGLINTLEKGKNVEFSEKGSLQESLK